MSRSSPCVCACPTVGAEVVAAPDAENKPDFGASFEVPNKLLEDVSVLVGCPKSDVPGVVEACDPNLGGMGVEVGVVDSGDC